MRASARAPATIAFALFLATCAPLPTVFAGGIIAGSTEPCSNEGENVSVSTIKDMRCFECICKNGFVECVPEHCPDVKNCYMQMPKEGCCVKCKGCLYNGTMHDSHTEWTDSEDPCRVLRCEAGVITESTTQCYTPCGTDRTPAKGHCCPSCQGCHINGQRVSEGRDATIEEDPCLTCHCSKSKLTCVKRACPVLPCPTVLQVIPKGKCCPVCSEGKQAKLLFPDHNPNKPCILGKDFHSHGKSFTLDKCTTCSCINGTTICNRESCPVLECAKEHQKTSPGKCCPDCPPVEEVRTTCTVGGKTYEDLDSWRLDECKSCMCHSGEPRCAMEQCPHLSCPLGHKMERPPGQCCYKCVEKDSVCTVFGDPHYKTFDGKFYNFQGSCKYQLTADCANHSFSIRVTNDAGLSGYSSRTKTVSFKMGDIKVNLGRKMRVKINGQRVDLPYEGPVGKISKDKYNNILVTSVIGIKLFWNGAGYLEVMAPISYKNKLCGLCGNFNSIVRDDLTTRNGNTYIESSKGNYWKFGDSWRVGGRKACSRAQENIHKDKPCDKSRKKFAKSACKLLTKSEAFTACRHKINLSNYYESCMMDMCKCQTNDCYCESFNAYARECTRLGAITENWRTETRCGGGPGKGKFDFFEMGRRQRHKSTSPPSLLLPISIDPLFKRPLPGRVRPPSPPLN